MDKKIFGLGLPKTGTSSLAKYLENMGVPTIHDDVTFFRNRGNVQSIKSLVTYDAYVGSLCVTRYEIIEKFTDAKFIITDRDKKTWMESAKIWFSHPGNPNIRMELFGCPMWDEEKFSKVYDTYITDLVEVLEKNECDYIIIDIINTDEGVVAQQICDFIGVVNDDNISHSNGRTNVDKKHYLQKRK
jgi:hypothetical protein